MTKKKATKKLVKVKEFKAAEAGSTRFFFTANPELTKWIHDSGERLGLYPYEFIRARLTQAMKE